MAPGIVTPSNTSKLLQEIAPKYQLPLLFLLTRAWQLAKLKGSGHLVINDGDNYHELPLKGSTMICRGLV